MDCKTTMKNAVGKAAMLALTCWCGAPWTVQGAVGPTIKVLAVQGAVTLAHPGANSVPVEPGAVISAGATLQTHRGAFMDLGLGEPCGTLRLTENTVLRIDRAEGAHDATLTAIQVTLERGIVIGFGNHVDRPSRYQIKIPESLLGVKASQFRVDARGYTVVLDGDAIVAHLDDGGMVTSHVLRAPPAVYYAPGFGVQTAPPALVHEVLRQATGTLNMPAPGKVDKSDPTVPADRKLEPAFEFPTLQPRERPKRRS